MVLSAAMSAMERDHADEMAQLKEELLKLQQEKYVLSAVRCMV